MDGNCGAKAFHVIAPKIKNSGKISICQRLDRSFRKMQRVKRLRVSEVNPHLICVLCGGYYIDATTIIECLHTFCKTCIVGYLEASKHCPVCDNLVHKTKPHLRLRPDHTLQDLVYKLVPGLFQDEMKKRREFYKEEIETGRVGEYGIPEERERIIYSADEQISLVIELSSDGNPPYTTGTRSSRQPRLEAADRRYLSCPGNFTVGHLKKFIKMKFNLCDRYQIDFYHTDETLFDHYTLVDIAYIYSWRRKGPLRLYYTVYTNPAKRFKLEIEDTVPMETDISNVTNTSLKTETTETSGYLSDDDKMISESEKSLEKDTDDSKHDSVLDGDGLDIDNGTKTVKVDEISITEKVESLAEHEKDRTDECRSEDHKENGVSEVNLKETENANIVEEKTDNSENTDMKFEPAAQKSEVIQAPKLADENMEVSESTNDVTQTNHANGLKELSEETDQEIASSENTSKLDRDKDTDSKKTDPDVEFESSEKPEMVEVSTATTASSTVSEKCNVQTVKLSKSCITDEDISEHIVSSTQNTQGSQTEPPESSDALELPHSSGSDLVRSPISPLPKSTVDVSCETDNFVNAHKSSKESVSVSTETETDKHESKVKETRHVDCSTDVYDFPKSEENVELPVTSSKNLMKIPMDSPKRKSLSLDCSTGTINLPPSTNKRKSSENFDTDNNSSKLLKKLDNKSYKRSYSYTGQLATPKVAYLAQPLSPTKITLKFTAPKSPVKGPSVPPAPKSPSRAETSGFQSQYQSFVMEKPDNTYKFDEEDPPKQVKPVTIQKSLINPVVSLTKSAAQVQKKTQSKTGRPRGRPPKNRSLEDIPLSKEKKHKSRSQSPKYTKLNEKSKNVAKDRFQTAKSVSGENCKASNAYMFMRKLDSVSKPVNEQKEQKPKDEKGSSDLRIPKQFLYFSNGQYTIATESSLAALKQSSPVSPPPRTVFSAEVKSNVKVSSYNETNKKPVISSPLVNIVKLPETKDAEKTKTCGPDKSVDSANERQLLSVKELKQKEQNSSTVTNSDTNLNKVVRKSESQSLVTKDSAKRKLSPVQEKDVKGKDTNKDSNPDKPVGPLPEYRHQSPFFASMNNAKLHAPQRSTTHLNIPNLSSHFSGTRQLYSQQSRYAGERTGTPLYRSFSMSDKSPTSSMVSKMEEAQRLEAMATASRCSYLPPFPAPYLGLMHSHLVSSLPPPPALSKHGHYPDTSRPITISDAAINSMYTLSQMTGKHKNAASNQKGKSIDKVISAITEMKTKKATQEQMNGIDLSTKSSRKNEDTKEADDKAESIEEDDKQRKIDGKTADDSK